MYSTVIKSHKHSHQVDIYFLFDT